MRDTGNDSVLELQSKIVILRTGALAETGFSG
jgi:hypothetical protein